MKRYMETALGIVSICLIASIVSVAVNTWQYDRHMKLLRAQADQHWIEKHQLELVWQKFCETYRKYERAGNDPLPDLARRCSLLKM